MVEEVTPVGVLTTATHEAVDVVPQPHAPNHIKHIKSALDWSSTTLKVVNAAGNLFKNITPALKFGLRCTKIPSILISPYKAYELIVNLIKIFSHSGKFYDKVKAGLKSITLINDLTKATAAFLKIFITAKLISDTFGCWIPYFDVVDVFIGPIEIGLKGDSVFKLYKLRREINSLIKDAERSSPLDTAKKWDSVLERVEKEKVADLRTKLSISKKADLATRVSALRATLQTTGDTTNAVKESSNLMKVLVPRITKQFGYEVAELANKVAITAGAVLTVLTPLFMVGAVILLTTAVTSLVLMSGRAMLIHKNPFDENSRSRAEALLDLLIPSRKEALCLRKQVQVLSLELREQEAKIQSLVEQRKKTQAEEAHSQSQKAAA